MAQPIQYTVRAPRTGTSAREELDRLLETCHRHGVLRLANDLVASNTALAQVIVQGLQNEGVTTAIKNLSVLAMALSRIPPEEFYRVVFALKNGLTTLAGASDAEHAPQGAPGLSGAYHMLHDQELWQALTPLVAALKAFAAGLEQKVENPISSFSGKPGRPS